MKRADDKISFSIIIPLKSGSNYNSIKECLKALTRQTFTKFEVILITDPITKITLINCLNFQFQIRWVEGYYSKIEARNIGASIALGNFLIHIDADYILDRTTLDECAKTIYNSNVEAIIANETLIPKKSIWQKARILERLITINNEALSAPQIINKKLFKKINGYDERSGELDDWDLNLKLKKLNISPAILSKPVIVYEPVNPIEISVRRYKKGRYLPILKFLHKDVPQDSIQLKLKLLISKNKLLIANPITAFALIILKLFDFIPFFLGTLNPVKVTITPVSPYKLDSIAASFDKEQLSKSSLYKNFKETTSLFELLESPKTKILELGAGTGRITKQLIEKGYKVTPTDISAAMLKILKNKKGIPVPVLIKDSCNLPFKNNSFDYIVSFRVIWHILNKKEREKFFTEAVRVSKRKILIDFTNIKKYNNPLIKTFIKKMNPFFFSDSYYFSLEEISKLAKQNKIKITKIIKLEVLPPFLIYLLPTKILNNLEIFLSKFIEPGRFLILFEK